MGHRVQAGGFIRCFADRFLLCFLKGRWVGMGLLIELHSCPPAAVQCVHGEERVLEE